MAHDAAGSGQPERLALAVEVRVQAAALGPDGGAIGSTRVARHRREVDHEAVVAQGVAGHGVASAPHRRRKLLLAGEPHGGDDVGHARTTGDERRTAMDVAVPDLAGLVVAVGSVG